MRRRGRLMSLLRLFKSLILVAHVGLYCCVDVLTCCFGVMLCSIHMRLLCHGSLPFGKPQLIPDTMASPRAAYPSICQEETRARKYYSSVQSALPKGGSILPAACGLPRYQKTLVKPPSAASARAK
jgi:hypothetical protein